MSRPKKLEARRESLVEAALSAVSDSGLRDVSLTGVASRAALTRGAILCYDEDLEALLVEADRAGPARFCDARDAEVALLDDPREQLACAIRAGLPSGPDGALIAVEDSYGLQIVAGSSRITVPIAETARWAVAERLGAAPAASR